MQTNKQLVKLQTQYRLKNAGIVSLLRVSPETVKRWRLLTSPGVRNMHERDLQHLKTILYCAQYVPPEILRQYPPPFDIEPLMKAQIVPKYAKK